jgi:hypothetical protein
MTRSGPALIVLPGKSYATEKAEYDGRGVSFVGRLRVGSNADQYRLAKSYAIPIDRVSRIEWLDGSLAVAA